MAHFLIIDLPGGNDTDIVDTAIKAGHTFSFLTSQLHFYKKQSAIWASLHAAVEHIEVQDFEYRQVENAVLALHGRHPIDAIICLIDIRLIDAARLAERLKLRYLNTASAVLLRDKFNVRRRLLERGLVQPEFALATSNSELKQAVRYLGLPVLIKPADGYGSQNIVILRTEEDLAPWITPLENMLPSRTDYGLGVVANDRLLIERYMEGTVIGCDTLTVNGHHQLLGVNEKQMFAPPSFAIKGGCFKPNAPEFSEIEKYVFAVLNAVDFDWGATHMELMLTADGPRVIEINPRLVGAKIARLVSYALGRSVHHDLLNVHLGQEPLPTKTPGLPQIAVTRWITASEAGALASIRLPEWTSPLLRCSEIFKSPGDFVRVPFENADRIGYVMTCGPSKVEAESVAERFVADTCILLQT